jgi:hypothetical protein
MKDATFADMLLSLVIGGFLGWTTGGIYNLINGRRWSGKLKK